MTARRDPSRGSRCRAIRAIAITLVVTAAGCTGIAQAERVAAPLPTACPAIEPSNGARCAVAAGNVCSFTIRTSRSVHCHCMGQVWDCGTPLGIDVPTDATCPATQPVSGSACTLPARPAAPGGNRPGCYYEVAMNAPHQCVCAHPASAPERGTWDCGLVSTPAPTDAHACPARRPADETICTVPPRTECQYGFNLSTSCRCNPISASNPITAWQCTTTPMPPAPSHP